MTTMILLHCNKGKSDKIWGWTETADGAVSFWGRRKAKTLSFMRYDNKYLVKEVARQKYLKGYDMAEGPQEDYLPEDFQGQMMLATLGMVRESVKNN
jgi:hypothetical protein